MNELQGPTQEKAALIAMWLQKYGHAFSTAVEDAKVDVYIDRLSRYSVKKLENALAQALDNDFRFPTIASIRQWIEPLEDPRNPRKEYRDLTK